METTQEIVIPKVLIVSRRNHLKSYKFYKAYPNYAIYITGNKDTGYYKECFRYYDLGLKRSLKVDVTKIKVEGKREIIYRKKEQVEVE